MESCKWLHSFTFFNSLLKLCAWTDAKSYFFAFLCFSPEWVWVSSICWPVQMQSCIDGICTLFLQSEFECPQIACLYRCKVALVAFECCLNVSSNCLPEQMQSGIGCICPLFLQSEFSNVSSNCLPVQMHSRIDCIRTTFHLREFSDVFSNRLPE